jgi:hypothetical protein
MPLQDRTGPVTPEQLLSEALFIANEIEDCLLVVRYKDKGNHVEWTNLREMTALGLTLYAKKVILDGFIQDPREEPDDNSP